MLVIYSLSNIIISYSLNIVLTLVILFILFRFNNKKKTKLKTYYDKVIKDNRNQLLNAVLKGNHQPMVIIDAEFKIKSFNDIFLQDFYVVGKYNLILPSKFEYIYDFAQSEETHGELEISYQDRDYLVNLNRFVANSFEGIIVTYTNITYIRSVQRQESQFIQDAKHELKTPIAAIKGLSELIIDGKVNDAYKLQQFVKTINKESQRLQDIVDSLTSLAEAKPNCNYLDLSDFFDNISVIFENKKDNIALIINNSIKGEIYSDDKFLSQIIINLVENSFKYTDYGTITIDAIDQVDCILLVVTDTGIGIGEKDLPYIFERFYRTDKSRQRATGGVGLGLNIVKQLVEKLNGTIEIKSVKNEGTSIAVTLPKSNW